MNFEQIGTEIGKLVESKSNPALRFHFHLSRGKRFAADVLFAPGAHGRMQRSVQSKFHGCGSGGAMKRPDRIKRIFVCSPLRGDGSSHALATNILLARKLCKAVCDVGHAPFAPHAFYTEFLDDRVLADRDIGIKCGIAWLGQADEMWIYADDFDSCSEGMKAEIERSQRFSLSIRLVYRPLAWEGIGAAHAA